MVSKSYNLGHSLTCLPCMCATRLSSIRCLYGIQDVQIIFHRHIACIGTFLYKVIAMLLQVETAIESVLYDCIYNSVLCACIL